MAVWAQADVAASAAASRTYFELGRIQSAGDWFLPILVLAAVVAYVIWMYRRDSVELHPAVSVLLSTLRIFTFVGLLIVYLQPQWRTEKTTARNSRVLLAVDTSLSMGLTDQAGASESAGSRQEEVIRALSQGDLLQKLRQTHDVTVVRFDQQLERVATLPKLSAAQTASKSKSKSDAPSERPVDWAAVLAPRGTETRLGQSLRQAINDERLTPGLSGVVVFSDGGQNVGIEPSAAIELARQIKVPIHTVGLGSDRQPANVRISDFLAPTRAYPGDNYKVTGYLQAYGLGGQTVTVELLSRPLGNQVDESSARLEETRELTLGGDGEPLAIEFDLTPEETGQRTLMLRVQPPPDDRFTGDNQQEADIEIVDRKSRILLFAGGPAREFQYLRNQLQRDASATVETVLQSAGDEFPDSREELYAYDCVVAFDPDWQALTASQIDLVEKWVADQAGGLIVIAGPIYTDRWVQADTPAMDKVRDLYPVEFNSRFLSLEDARYGSTEPWPIDLTREGLESQFLWLEDAGPKSQQTWAAFRGVYGYYAVRGPKRAATVYGYYSDPRAAGADSRPVYLAGQFFGSGRVFYLGSAEMWRLREVDDGYFEKLYTQLLRHVSQGRLSRGSSRGVLLVERDRYFLGDMVAVRAQLTNAQLDPLEAAEVPMQVLAPDGSVRDLKLAADTARPGAYSGQFAVRQEGAYRLVLPVPQSESEELSRRIQVRVPDLERENPQRNDALLSEIASSTGGVYYIGTAAALAGQKSEVGGQRSEVRGQKSEVGGRGSELTPPSPGTPGEGRGEGLPVWELLPDRTQISVLPEAPDPIWDNWWTLGLICGCLCVEWLIRRLAKLA
jgi:hypothetical protein